MSKLFLKVKIKSLAAEARIIRAEERRRRGKKVETPRHSKTPLGELLNDQRRSVRLRYVRPLKDGDPFFALRAHRTNDVRREARAALLAYAYLRGKYYRVTETWPLDREDGERSLYELVGDCALIDRIANLVLKYGGQHEFDRGVAPIGWHKNAAARVRIRFWMMNGYISRGEIPPYDVILTQGHKGVSAA